MKFKFCPLCGNKLVHKLIGDEVDLPYCESCSRPYFDWFGQTVLVTVVNEYNEILLIRQDYVSKFNWVLIAGFMKQGDTAEQTVIREVLEETGQNTNELIYVKSYFFKKKDLLMLGFIAKVQKQEFNNSSEVDELEWFKPNDALALLKNESIGKSHLENSLKILDLCDATIA